VNRVSSKLRGNLCRPVFCVLFCVEFARHQLLEVQGTLQELLDTVSGALRVENLTALQRGTLSGVVLRLTDMRDAVVALVVALADVGAGGFAGEGSTSTALPFEWTSRVRYYTVVVRSARPALAMVVACPPPCTMHPMLSVAFLLAHARALFSVASSYALPFVHECFLRCGRRRRAVVQAANPTAPDSPLPPGVLAKSTVAVECGDVRLPYGFEFLGASYCGGPHSLVVSIPGDRTRLALFHAVASGSGAGVVGGVSVGKLETLRATAGALGRSLAVTPCSAALTPAAVTASLLACFAGWVLFLTLFCHQFRRRTL
jgi:hypothetical protein